MGGMSMVRRKTGRRTLLYQLHGVAFGAGHEWSLMLIRPCFCVVQVGFTMRLVKVSKVAACEIGILPARKAADVCASSDRSAKAGAE